MKSMVFCKIEFAVKLETPLLQEESQSRGGVNASPDMGTSPTTGDMTITIVDFAEIINNIRASRGLIQDETSPRARVIFDKYGISVDLCSVSLIWGGRGLGI